MKIDRTRGARLFESCLSDLMSFPGTSSIIFLILAMCQPAPLLAQSTAAANQSHRPIVPVPFVGCASDGQVGPLKAPKGTSKVVPISPEVALRLAYYKAAQGSGILAPRGWYCFGTYGSNGDNLFVSPKPIDSPIWFPDRWGGFAGAAIQVSDMVGDTSGRFEVARFIARVFPAHMAFVKRVIAEGIEPASSFPRGPHPGDKLAYLNKDVVEYETPANQDGLGTESAFKKSGNAISRVAILTGEELSLIYLAVRLPPDATDLGPVIIREIERKHIRHF